MKTPIVLALALTLALVLAGCAPAESTVHLQQERDSDTITVTGRVGLEVTPDVAQVSIGVSSQAATPGDARLQNSTAINATLAALAELGIEEKDIQTSNMNLWNRYDNNGNIIGYRMSTDLTIYVREIEKAGEVVDAAIEAARQKAEALATASGKILGEVQQVDETSRAVATVREFANADTGGGDAMNDRAKTTIRPGSTQIDAEVKVVFRAE